MPRTMYEKLLQVIVKRPDARTEYECQDLVPWFRNKSVLFETLKPGTFHFGLCQNRRFINA